MSRNDLYSGKCIVILTGASRGFGCEIARLIANNEDGIFSNTDPGSRMILMSRDQAELNKTKFVVEQMSERFEVSTVSIDLSNVQSSQKLIDDTLNNCSKDFKHAFLFSNAGTLGDPGKSIPDYDNIEEIQNIYNLNVVSSSYLISTFCRVFERASRVVVNTSAKTSSLGALQPFKFTGLYSTCKACMDMFIQNLVVDCPDVRALNYAPGPMDTQMARELRDGTRDEGTRSYIMDLFSTGKIINPSDSVKKLLMLLRKNDYTNGSHIDFYDV